MKKCELTSLGALLVEDPVTTLTATNSVSGFDVVLRMAICNTMERDDYDG